MVSVKIDLCTRNGRHFIGINFQAFVESKLKVGTATVQEMNVKATSSEISQLMIKKLNQFNTRMPDGVILTPLSCPNLVIFLLGGQF